MREHVEPIWDRIRDELRREVPDFKFHIWLEPLELAGVDGQTLFVRAPAHIRTWVRDRYLPVLRGAAARGFAPGAVVEIVDETWTAPDPAAAVPSAGAATERDERDVRLNPKYTFEQFVIGAGNRFAHAAALAVAELPGQTYNPLFIHGRPGLGKTHLLHAIGNYVNQHGSGLTVRYATVEQFTNAFVQAVRDGSTHDFKARFREVDVLLLDDVQFLADKARTEEELFHTFNALHDSGRQLVMTSDRSPAQLDGIAARLGERFGSGLVVAVEQPDRAVRHAILEKRVRVDSVEASTELVAEIADRVTTSVRALEAALIQVVAYASLRGERPTPDHARRLLDRLAGAERRRPDPTVDDVLAATATRYGLTTKQLVARDRRPDVARARKVAIYLARELTGTSLPEIGRRIGGRDHSTILTAVRSLAGDLERDPQLAQTVDELRTDLSNRPS
ncbi:MAG: chromosomal replication initiator protein DnaA [Solirubrobacterales bacterium]|nr:chromosomal replication initiator protein DnaA [Solirubrobacterales bacterium]